MTEEEYTEEEEQLYRAVYTAVENVIVSDFGIGAVGLSDEVTEAALTVVIGWLAEHDRQVAERAWERGWLDEPYKRVDENPYRRASDD